MFMHIFQKNTEIGNKEEKSYFLLINAKKNLLSRIFKLNYFKMTYI